MLTIKHAVNYKWPTMMFTCLSLLILLPLLRPGFIFALDMVPTPVWRLPAHVTSSYPFYALMHAFDVFLPADLLQKILLFGTFLASGLGMYRLSARLRGSESPEAVYGAYFAGVLYVLNPFTYSRFLAGQYAVLMGYALLPWFALVWLDLLRKPAIKKAVTAGLLAAIIGIVSIHSLGFILLFAAISVAAKIWQKRRESQYIRYLTKCIALALAVFIVLSGFWLVPALLGRGSTAEAVNGFGTGDQQAFATTGSNPASRLVSVSRLQGFWVEREGLYRMPQSIGIVWWLAFTFVLLLVVMGAVRFWKIGKKYECIVFGVTAAIAAIFAAGIFSTPLSQHVPFFAGYREPQKFTALLALAYALFAGAGATTVLQWQPKKYRNAAIFTTLALIAVPFLFSPSMILGGGKQLAVHQYPDGWYTVNDRLNADTGEYKTLFLPWHLYMHFGFSRTIMANPAQHFFDKQVLVSNNPEFSGSSPSTYDPVKQKIGTELLPAAIKSSSINKKDFAASLSRLGIKYVILTSESDYEKYNFIQEQPGMQLVYKDPAIRLYKNSDFGRE